MIQQLIDKNSLKTYLKLLCSAIITMVSKDGKEIITVTKCSHLVNIIKQMLPKTFGQKKLARVYNVLFDPTNQLVYDIQNQTFLALQPNKWYFGGMKLIKTKEDIKQVLQRLLEIHT